MRTFTALIFTGATLVASQTGLAQTTVATDEMKEVIDKEKEDGWKVTGKVGASFSLNQNDRVVGTEDGLTIQLGGVFSLAAVYSAGNHGWSTTLDLQQTQTRTPGLDRFIKSLDQLDLITTYTYRFNQPAWLGLFARASLNTQVFAGEIIATDNNTEVRRIGRTASADDLTIADTANYQGAAPLFLDEGDAVTVTNTFEPLNLRQSAGVFADPIQEKEVTVTIKVGIASQEIITRNADIEVTRLDGPNGPVVVVRELEPFVFELGAETELDVRGSLIEERLGYFTTINAFFPPFTTSDIDRSFADSINLRLKSGLSLKLVDGVNLEYVLTVLRIPATTTDYQVQNGLLLSLGFDII